MIKRLGIFCFYDKDGIVDEYIDYLLEEFTSCLCRLIIVINGNVSQLGMNVLKKYSSEIVIRKNEGFDAGAYKHILINYLGNIELRKYDEIAFCNDTFFGPLIPFRTIFSRMEHMTCDYWGLNYTHNDIADYIHSYFLVFRKGALYDDSLYTYFVTNIHEKNLDYRVACGEFEAGLFSYLHFERHKKFAYFARANNSHIYKSCNYCVKKYGVPIIKLKAFSKEYLIEDNIKDLLLYIYESMNYDITYILQAIKRRYLLDIEKREIKHYINAMNRTKEIFLNSACKGRKEIIRYIDSHEFFYIFGDGLWAVQVYCIYVKNCSGFRGFIITNNYLKSKDSILGNPVFKAAEVKNIEKQNIMVILNHKNSMDVCEHLRKASNIFYLY